MMSENSSTYAYGNAHYRGYGVAGGPSEQPPEQYPKFGHMVRCWQSIYKLVHAGFSAVGAQLHALIFSRKVSVSICTLGGFLWL